MKSGSRLVLIAMLACIVRTAAATDGYFDPTWPAGIGGGRTVFAGDPRKPFSASVATQIIREPNGNLLLGGSVDLSYWWFGELNADGTPSLLYGESDGSGIATECYLDKTTSPCAGWLFARMALLPDGRVAVLDQSDLSRATDQAHGYDTSVTGGSGYVQVSGLQINQAKGYLSSPNGLARTPAGKWLVIGSGFYTQVSTNLDFVVVQLNSDFSLDTSFNSTSTDPAVFQGGQRVAFDLPGGDKTDNGGSVQVQSDGRIVLGGTANTGSTYPTVVFARLNADGSVDSSFGSSGKYLSSWSAGTQQAFLSSGGIRLDSGDRILFAQIATRTVDNVLGVTVTRLTADGLPDTMFGGNSDGVAFEPLPAQCTTTNYYPLSALALDSAGRVLVAGGCGTFYLFRLRGDNGSLDTTFGFGGYSSGSFDASSTASTATDLTFDGSGHLVLVGNTAIGGKTKVGVARLTYDLVFTNNFEKVPRGCSPPDCN